MINKPISKMLEDQLVRQRDLIKTITPFQWLNDPVVNPELPQEDDHFKDLEEYITNEEEEEFCKANPDHPRAKIRKSLVKEYEHYILVRLENQKETEKNLIRRWMEVFHPHQ